MNTRNLATNIDANSHNPAETESFEPEIDRNHADRLRERRLRRLAHRQGLALQKAPFRNPSVFGWQLYRIVDPVANFVVAGGSGNGYDLDLDDVEACLREE